MGVGIMQLARGDKPPPRNRPIMLLDQNMAQSVTQSTGQSPSRVAVDNSSPSGLSGHGNLTGMNGVMGGTNNANLYNHMLNGLPILPNHGLGSFQPPFPLQSQHDPPNQQQSFQSHAQPPPLHTPFPLFQMGMAPKFRIKPPPNLQLLSNDGRKLSANSADLLRRAKNLLRSGYTIMAPEPSAGFKSSWGLMLQEMNWMATDYHQERVWKRRVCDALKMGVMRMIQQKDRDKKGWASNQAAKIISQWWKQLDLVSQQSKTEIASVGKRTKTSVQAMCSQSKQEWRMGRQSPELFQYCSRVQIHPEALQIEQYSANVELEPLDLLENLFISVTKVSGVDYVRNQHAAVDQYLSRMEAAGAKIHSVTFRPPDDELDSVSLSLNSDEDYASLVLNDYVLRKSCVVSPIDFDPNFNRFKSYMCHVPPKRMPLPVKSFPPVKPVHVHNSTASLPDRTTSVSAGNTSVAGIGSCVKEPYLLSHLVQKYGMKGVGINWELMATAMEMYGNSMISVNDLKNLHNKIDDSYPKMPLVVIDKLFGMVYMPKSATDELCELGEDVCVGCSGDDGTERMIKHVVNSKIEDLITPINNFEGMFEINCNVKTYEKVEQLAAKSINEFIEWYSHVDPKVAGQTNLLESTDDLLPDFLACVALKYPENNSIMPT